LLVNTTIDAGYTVDVNGTFKVQNTGTGDHTAIFSKSLGGNTNAYNATTTNVLTVTGTPTTGGYQTAALKNKLDISAGSTYNYTNGHEWSAMTNELNISSGGIVVQGADSISNTRIGSTIGYSRSIGTLTNHLIGTANYNIVGTVYDIFLAGVGGNQPTNYWGIYQQSSVAKNYFNGKMLIGTTVDAGFKLDVNGTARIGGGNGVGGSLQIVSGTGQYYPALSWVNNGASTQGQIIGYGGGLYTQVAGFFQFTNINNVTVGGAYGGRDNSAILQVNATNRGFLPPRMTNAQRTAIASPAVGLIVYCTDVVEGLYVYKSTGWTFIFDLNQETTSVTPATLVTTNTGDTVRRADTFDGYTVAQIVKALRNQGLLA
jgi:hypothetical protein